MRRSVPDAAPTIPPASKQTDPVFALCPVVALAASAGMLWLCTAAFGQAAQADLDAASQDEKQWVMAPKNYVHRVVDD